MTTTHTTTTLSLFNLDNMLAANEIAWESRLRLIRRNKIGEGPVIYVIEADGHRIPPHEQPALALLERLRELGYDTSYVR